MTDNIVRSDSAIYKGEFYGILNEQGDFWTPLGFGSETAARDHITDFWRNQPDMLAKCLRTHTIVPVRIQLSTIPVDASLSTEGNEDAG